MAAEAGDDLVIKDVSMPDELKDSAVAVCKKALENGRGESETAKRIKKEFDQLHGPSWHCVVGRNYGSFITHRTQRFIYINVGKQAVLLFKSA